MIAANSSDRVEEAEVQRDRGEIAGRGTERERGEDGGPVEALATASGDAVDRQRALAAVPEEEHPRDDDRVERGRHRIGQARPDRGHRRRPSCRRSRPSSPRTSRCGARYSRWRSCSHSANHSPKMPIAPASGTLFLPRKSDIASPMPGGEQLQDPEDHDDLRDLRQGLSRDLACGRRITHEVLSQCVTPDRAGLPRRQA